MLHGIDISDHQKGINLDVVPCDFVIIKATEGTNYVNLDCDRAYQQAKRNGKLLGVYHYANGSGAVAEAQHFLNAIQGYISEAILCLDWEELGNVAYHQYQSYAKTFLDYVYNVTGVHPLIYMSKSVTYITDWTSTALDCGLWCAQYANMDITGYQDNPWTDGNGFGAFGSPAIYQYSCKGRLNGYNGDLDLDLAYINADQWKKYAAGKKSGNNNNVPTQEQTENDIMKSDILELVKNTMLGTYGIGEQRKKVLGNRYGEVQDFINHIAYEQIGVLANETMHGKFGNGETRKIVLGTRYEEIQEIVNQICGHGKGKYHVVSQGETLSGIAQKYGVTLERLIGLNDIQNPDIIFVGQNIRIA